MGKKFQVYSKKWLEVLPKLHVVAKYSVQPGNLQFPEFIEIRFWRMNLQIKQVFLGSFFHFLSTESEVVSHSLLTQNTLLPKQSWIILFGFSEYFYVILSTKIPNDFELKMSIFVNHVSILSCFLSLFFLQSASRTHLTLGIFLIWYSC